MDRLLWLCAAALICHPSLAAPSWEKALSTTYTTSKVEVDADGQTEFHACFDGGGENCRLTAISSRDPFRKLTIFEPAKSSFFKLGARLFVRSYVSVVDCTKPAIMLNPRFDSKNGWLHMNRLGILVDGNVALDYEIPDWAIVREAESWGTSERATWIANDEQITALRLVAAGKQIGVRVSGQTSRAAATKREAEAIRATTVDLLKIYDKLTAAASSALAACPRE